MERADNKDAKQQVGGGWSSLFGVAGQPQGQTQGGLSPSRNIEVKKAIRAAMAFGLPKAAAGKGGAATSTATTTPSTPSAETVAGTSGNTVQGDGGGASGRESSVHGLGKGRNDIFCCTRG